MENKYLIAVMTFIIVAIATFVNLSILNTKNESRNKSDFFSHIICYTILLLSYSALIYITDKSDFIYNFNSAEFMYIFTAAAIIFTLYSWRKTEKIAFIAPIVGAAVLYFFIPENYSLYDIEIPSWVNKITIIGIFFAFSFFYKYINGLEGIFAIQTMFIGLGIFLLSMFNALPLLLGFMAISLMAVYSAFLNFNNYPANIKLSQAAASSSSFIIAWLLIKTGEEASLSCSLIFTMFAIIEIITALLKKLTFMQRYKDIYTNTFCYKANIKGLPIKIINNSVIKICILSIVIGCLQIYAPNSFSLPIFMSMIMIWFLNRISNWEKPKQTIKEMNRDFIKDLKDNIDDVKNLINRD